MRAARRPADHREPVDAECVGELEQLVREPRERAPAYGRAAAVDREQSNAESRRDGVVRVARQARVAAAVEVHDGDARLVADVVDDQRRVTISVARIPSAR